jgi:penicillin amidase
MTYGGIDTQDLFIERFREGLQGREVLYRGAWETVRVLQETIRVRGADPVPIEVTITHHGPVIAGDPASGKAIAVCDPGLIGPTRWLDAARDAMCSRSVDELHEALEHWTDRVNNYAVADVHGNFGYLHAGKVPIRPESNGWCAVPGWTGEYDWAGAIPHDELPKTVNPESGYVVTCNQRVTGHDYPYYVGIAFAPDHRARRVQSRLNELEPGTATVDDMVAIHGDRVSLPARIFVDALSAITPRDERCATALALLRDWDRTMDRGAAAPTIYAATRAQVARRLAQQNLGDLASQASCATANGKSVLQHIELPMLAAIECQNAALLPDGENWEGLLAEALEAAVVDLTRTLGPDLSGWQWGRVHHTSQQHSLSAICSELAPHMDPPTFAVHGDSDTPLAGSYALDAPFIARTASVNRYVHDPSDWTRSVWIVPLGASGHPASPHWSDQAEAWSNVETIPQLWDWAQIEREAETTQRLDPV